MTRAAAPLLAALALLVGCASTTGQLHLPPRAPAPGPEEGDYAALRDAASRRARLYDGLVHLAGVNAAWLSPPVREAGTRRLAAWQGWGPAELARALAADQAEASKGEEFVVSLYTADRRHNDLADRGSIWRIQLDDGAVQAAASAVEVLTADATARQLFPFIGPFDVAYRVRIPWAGAPLAGRPFTLQLRSALGALVLDFGPDGKPADRPRMSP